MPFHVEVSSPGQHARVFNVDEDELRTTVLEPWTSGVTLEVGEQKWDPRESKLTILEGPALEPPDLAFGQGWSNALRDAEDVTAQKLEVTRAAAPVREAGVIEASSLEDALERLGSGSRPESTGWSTAIERIDGRDPEVTAVILVVRPPGANQG
jgi:hypothetical protein